MKENDPLIIMTHTLIENSAPRPQLYQQVRPAKGFAPPPPHQSLLFFWSVVQCSFFSVQVLMASWEWSPCIVCITSTFSSIAFDCSPVIVMQSHAKYGHDLKRSSLMFMLHFSVTSPPHSQVCVWRLDTVYCRSCSVFRKYSASCGDILN